MKNYGYLLLGLATLTSSSYAADQAVITNNPFRTNISQHDKNFVVSKTELKKKTSHKKQQENSAKSDKTLVISRVTSKKKTSAKKDDEFKLGKIVALSEDGLRKNHGFTHIDKMPSWDFGYGAQTWLTKPGAKVIVPRSNGQYTYGIVLKFERPIITILVDKNTDDSYKTKEFRADKLNSLKWIHKTWLTKKRGAILMAKEKTFVNYNQVTKNFDTLAL
jgi:hypothetical protein